MVNWMVLEVVLEEGQWSGLHVCGRVFVDVTCTTWSKPVSASEPKTKNVPSREQHMPRAIHTSTKDIWWPENDRTRSGEPPPTISFSHLHTTETMTVPQNKERIWKHRRRVRWQTTIITNIIYSFKWAYFKAGLWTVQPAMWPDLEGSSSRCSSILPWRHCRFRTVECLPPQRGYLARTSELDLWTSTTKKFVKKTCMSANQMRASKRIRTEIKTREYAHSIS